MSDEHDDLTGIFDDLKPEDFTIEEKRGIIAFDKFVKENINSVRMAYVASEGVMNPVAVFASPDNEWIFTPNDDENMGQYLNRLREAAKTLHATWFFISRKAMVGTYVAEGIAPDLTDREAIEAAKERGDMAEGIMYYAERLEEGIRDCRHGLMRADEGRLGQVIEGNPNTQGVGLFSNILS